MHVIMEVDEIIIREEWITKNGKISMSYDCSLLFLKESAKFSWKFSPFCLPIKEQIYILERRKNIVVGFGASNIWFIEYNRLLGGKLKSASMITPKIVSNKSNNLDWPRVTWRRIWLMDIFKHLLIYSLELKCALRIMNLSATWQKTELKRWNHCKEYLNEYK